MKKLYIFLTIGLVVIVAAITNPDQTKHREAIKSKIGAEIQKKINESASGDAQAIGMMLGQAFLDKMVDNIITADSYVLFSLTKATWEGKTRIIGIGAFGNVFLIRRIDDSIAEGFKNVH